MGCAESAMVNRNRAVCALCGTGERVDGNGVVWWWSRRCHVQLTSAWCVQWLLPLGERVRRVPDHEDGSIQG